MIRMKPYATSPSRRWARLSPSWEAICILLLKKRKWLSAWMWPNILFKRAHFLQIPGCALIYYMCTTSSTGSRSYYRNVWASERINRGENDSWIFSKLYSSVWAHFSRLRAWFSRYAKHNQFILGKKWFLLVMSISIVRNEVQPFRFELSLCVKWLLYTKKPFPELMNHTSGLKLISAECEAYKKSMVGVRSACKIFGTPFRKRITVGDQAARGITWKDNVVFCDFPVVLKWCHSITTATTTCLFWWTWMYLMCCGWWWTWECMFKCHVYCCSSTPVTNCWLERK